MKKRLLFGFALAALFLYLSLRKVDLSATWSTLREASYWHFAFFLIANVFGLWVRSVRWAILMKPIRAVSARRLLPPLSIGLMANLIFPARAGEFVRAYMVGRREGVSSSATFATVVVERLFDGLAIISFMGLAPFFLPASDNPVAAKLQWAGLTIFGGYMSLMIVLLVLSHHREGLTRFLDDFGPAKRWRLVRRICDLILKFADGLAVLKSGSSVLAVMGLSYVVWGMSAGLNLLMMDAIDLTLPLYASFFLVVNQSFGAMVPSPGFLGSYQYAHIIALSIYAVSKETALSLSILNHSGYFIVFIGVGVFFLFREHLGWTELKKATVEKEEDPAAGK